MNKIIFQYFKNVIYYIALIIKFHIIFTLIILSDHRWILIEDNYQTLFKYI